MPRMRQVYVPQPIMGKTAEQLRAYIDGPDMKTGRPFMQEVIEGLTRPLDSQDLRDSSFDRSTPRFLEVDTEENLHALFEENNWTDYLPIVLPTEERVEAMLKNTSHARDEIIGRMRPTHFREYWAYDVEKVAVNAVMAGARPEYFPAILAMAASGVSARGSTTSSAAAMCVVNGPIRHELSMNSGTGRDGAVQPRQRHHRAGLGAALHQPPGRLDARADLPRLAGQQLRLHQHHVRRERGAEPLEPVPRPARLQARRTAPSACSAVPAPRRSRSACARTTGRSTSSTWCAASTRTPRSSSCSTRSPRSSSSIVAASTPRRS